MILDDKLKNKLKEAINGYADVAQSVKEINLTDDIFLQGIADIIADKIMKDVYNSITKANATSQTAVTLELEQLYGKYGLLRS